jgi:ABC-type transport system involved in multi-copper enzyme maturation permease subunit
MVDDSKFFEAAQALAQSLSQWDLLIIAGSLVVIVSTSYYRPDTRRMRAAYLLFLPAWCSLALSVYQGIQVQGSYVAYLVANRSPQVNHTTINQIALSMEDATRRQIQGLEFALLCLALWLLIYISWWVFAEKPLQGGGGK